ncbi:MAG: hypothetical protein P1V97_22710, partial [Planctomycetota bacterium]|nr:hypothetical protein [Planctomycetota bacterium]
ALPNPHSKRFAIRFPRQLEDLNLITPALTKQTLQSLASLTMLQSLNLIGVSEPSDLSFFENFRQLQCLSLTPSVFIKALPRIPHIERLKKLTLSAELNAPHLFDHLASLPGLTSLTINKDLLDSAELIRLREHSPLLTEICLN